MKITNTPGWDPRFFKNSQIFRPLVGIMEHFQKFEKWPGLAAYQDVLDLLDKPIITQSGKKLTIVQQDGKPGYFHEHYAPRIYQTGEIQTRTENWHDFFQYLSWIIFPVTKSVINEIHIPAAQMRYENEVDLGRRSPIENMLSLFDEGGAIVVSSDASLLQMVREFKWKELFWNNRHRLNNEFDCFVFGHALFEKALNPYIGMTANCILIEVDEKFLKMDIDKQLKWLDIQVASVISEKQHYTQPRDLHPFPILGVPEWDSKNKTEEYYDNTQYFRTGRKSD